MKKYRVCALGNALVDVEIEVDDDFLQKAGISKGVMALVDEKRQAELLAHVESIPHKRTCGGSAANTVIALAQLGGSAHLSCRVATDDAGDFYWADLKEHGVDSNLQRGRESGVTGQCLVFITPDAERSMQTFLGTSTQWGEGELDAVALKDADYLYIEGYLVANPNAKAAILQARQVAQKAGVKTALSLSDPNLVAHFKGSLQEVVDEGVDLLFCNRDEALGVTGQSELQSAAANLASWCPLVAITLGEEGALVVTEGRQHSVPTHSVRAVDTNGAGDLFAGAFLHALTTGSGPIQAAHWACRASSVLVTHFGARLPKEQLLNLWHTFSREQPSVRP